MRLLVLGGTRFVGRHIVTAALAAGHEVTVLHRGRTGSVPSSRAHQVLADRERDLVGALGDETWDAVIDTSGYVPRVVRISLDALRDRVGAYVFVSTISVYDSFSRPDQNEDAPLASLPDASTETVNVDTYGALKVLCEQEVRAAFPDALIVRPGIIVGPYDYTDRFTYWVDRIARGGRVVTPAPSDAPLQVIDARDLATWMTSLVERGTGGTFNAVGPAHPTTFGDVFSTIREATSADAEFVWVDEDVIKRRGLAEQMPLWVPPSEPNWRYMFAIDAGRALAAGLSLRPLRATVRDTLEWFRGEDRPAVVGPTWDQEEAVLTEVAEVHG